MDAFNAMQDFTAGLEAQAAQLAGSITHLAISRQVQLAKLDEELLLGDGQDIQAHIRDIDTEATTLEQRLTVINLTLTGKRRSPTLAKLAQDAVAECREQIGDLQAQWDAQAEVLAAMDANRLQMVARLGAIHRDAVRLTARAVNTADRLTGTRQAAPELRHNVVVRRDWLSGCVFVDNQLTAKTFQKGE